MVGSLWRRLRVKADRVWAADSGTVRVQVAMGVARMVQVRAWVGMEVDLEEGSVDRGGGAIRGSSESGRLWRGLCLRECGTVGFLSCSFHGWQTARASRQRFQ